MQSTKAMSATTSAMPFVSIILPIRNEASFIGRSLRAVLSQDYPSDRLELIVADGMSTDGTREIVMSFQKQYPNVRLIDNTGQIVPTGFNAAIAQVRGEIIIRVDGHCEIAQDYVRNCVEHLVNDGVDGVGGPLETVGETLIARVIASAMSSPFGVGNSAFRTVPDKTMLTDTVAFPAYTRDIIEKAGLFDEELVRNQDDEYNYRLRKIGAKILLAADVRSRYYSRSSLRSLWRQYSQYGYWKVRVTQKHPRQMRLRQFIPFAFVMSLLVSLPLASFSSIGQWASRWAVGSYLFVNFSASILVAWRKGWRLLPLMPLTFAILHLAYGLGFLVGLIRFWNRWSDTRELSNTLTAPSQTA
jgi:glycosyltransferase involved in cell wall biosynthesis